MPVHGVGPGAGRPARRGTRARAVAVGAILAAALAPAAARAQGVDAALLVVPAPGSAARRVPITVAGGSPVVRAAQLAWAAGGTLVAADAERWQLRLGGTTFDLVGGLPHVRVAGQVIPLVAPVAGDDPMVPLQLAVDLLPRLARGVAYDPVTGVLRLGVAPAPGAEPAAVVAAAAVEPSEVDAAAPARVLPSIRGTRAADRLPAAGAPSASAAAAGRATARGARELPATVVPPARPEGRVVVVDAGHGGPDGGMQGGGAGAPAVLEKQVTLGIARALRDALAARGLGVVMTRARDTLVALADRGRIANQRRGDLFLSIHVNAANPAWRDAAATRGFETYFLSEARTDDARRVEAMENEVVRFETRAPAGDHDPLGFVIRDMAQNEHLRESSALADAVQRRLRQVHPGPSRGVKQAGFRVLVTAYMPAVLVEVGYGTNPADAAWMSSAAGQRQIARALADAATDYLARYERRVRPGAAGTGAGTVGVGGPP